MVRQKRIYKKTNGKCSTKIDQSEIQAQPLRSEPAEPMRKPTNSSFETNLILATVFLFLLGLTLYLIALSNINSHTNSVALQLSPLNKTVHLRDVQEKINHTQSNQPPPTPTEKTNPVPSFVDTWIQRIKKLSTQISVGKLIRAKQMLQRLSRALPDRIYSDQLAAYVRDYEINKFSEKPMCLVVPTYNNMKDGRYQKNIESILQQQYKNYKAIVIDDASDDGTAEAIQEYASTHQAYRQGRIKIQKNKMRKMALVNILDAAQNFCNEGDIFMVVDGDDYLLGKYVLKLFNAAFSSRDAWIVYSNFLTPNSKIGYSRRYPTQITESREFRRVLFIISHLRAFYTKLLLSIKREDLKDESGEYFHAANDVAIYMPMLEMASDHIIYLPEINYYYNSNTGMNNHQEKKKEQIRNDRLVRARPKYDKLQQLFERSNKQVSPIEIDSNSHYR